MRERSLMHLFDNIFWYTMYLLPVIAWLLGFLGGGYAGGVAGNPLSAVIEQGFNNNGVVYQALNKIVGPESEIGLNLFEETQLQLFNWFVCVYVVHLMVDFILFIPRLCHKWMEKFTSGR